MRQIEQAGFPACFFVGSDCAGQGIAISCCAMRIARYSTRDAAKTITGLIITYDTCFKSIAVTLGAFTIGAVQLALSAASNDYFGGLYPV